ncbi:MAG TPA: hypothetical protein VFG91_06790 [Woeseiaceae bacterium]|nr:hypothetical protein [Woeseiaceae bacterium]
MNRSSLSAAWLSTLLFAGAALACEYPDSPAVPNGSSASKEEMIAGQKEVNAYIKELETYQQCLVDEEEDARAELGEEIEPDVLKQREEVLTKKYNAAHDEMLKAAAAFNAELKEFNSRDE